MIRQPQEFREDGKKIRLLIAGYPGIGKTTLGLSAPRPLHIDVDHSIDRIEARYRKAYIQPFDYDEILNDLTPENVADFDTLVFDTGGKLLSLMSAWAMKKDPKYGQRDGSLSLKGYGAVGREFARLMDYCYYALKKHVVVIFHTVEEKDGDATKLRIKVEGQTKNNVWESVDLGGFVEMAGNDRIIGFSNCERYFAKGTRGISGTYRIPALSATSGNTFLTDLFKLYNDNLSAESKALETETATYTAAIERAKEIISAVNNAETANAGVAAIKEIKHALTSLKEIQAMWSNHVKSLGLTYDKISGLYTEKKPAARKKKPAAAETEATTAEDTGE